MNDIAGIIERSPWFTEIPTTGLAELTAAAQIKEHPVGACLYSVGEPTTAIYCVLEGRVRVSISSALGHEFTIVDLDSGAWLGEPCLIDDEPRLCTAQIKEKAQILSIPRNVVLEVGKQFPVLYRNLFKNSIRNERQLYELMGGMLFYPLRVRLAGRLLILLEEHGEVTSDGVMLETRLSQNDFAQLAMGSRQRVNKIFREWREKNILVMQNGNCLIKDIDVFRTLLDLNEDDLEY